MQGLFKFGFYEVFKMTYSNALGEVGINLNLSYPIRRVYFVSLVLGIFLHVPYKPLPSCIG